MKFNYKKMGLIAGVLSCLTLPGTAQLSGVYTISSASLTGGTNFQSFNALASALTASGVAGPVTVNVQPGTGPYVEQVTFTQFSGTSNQNMVTINGNNNLVVFTATSTAAPWTIAMNGADNMRFNNLNVQGLGAAAFPLVLHNGANSNVFSACTFSCPANGTSINQICVAVSGSSNSWSGTGNSGNNNLFSNCETFSGYYGITFYGPTAAGTGNGGNKVINCRIRDPYLYCINSYYHWNQEFRGNLMERPTRTTLTTGGGLFLYYSQGSLVEGNKVQKLFEMNPNSTSTCYGYYIYNYYATPPGVAKNTIRNNIMCDIKSNGLIYGIYGLYADGFVYHNTISLDHGASTAGTAYGMFCGSQPGQETEYRNNLITITKGGGTKFGIYMSNANGVSLGHNNVWMGGTGTNHHGFNGGNQTTLASWLSTGIEAVGYSINPQYVNVVTGNVMPTNAAFNNLASPAGVVFDYNDAVRNPNTPDIGALEFLTPACTGPLSPNSVLAPTFAICPGESTLLGIGTLNPDAGITYQWNASTVSNVGPFTPIAGATSLYYTAPTVTANTWFQVVMTCTNPGGGSTSAVGQVMVSGPTTSVVPAHEGFESVGLNNRLPNCSWSATNLGSANATYTNSLPGNRMPRTGSSYAGFSNTTPGTSAFYSNAIQLNAGITYSAAVFYATDYFGGLNWTNLSILVGPNQGTAGLVQIASVSPAISGPYKLIDGTFTVPSSGNYFICIRASSTTGSSQYLSIDDLSITIPCLEGNPNTPNLTAAISSSVICTGDQVNLTATGADVYLWSTGMSGATTVDTPTASGVYSVTGTNTLTGCTVTRTMAIVVNPAPQVIAVSNHPITCAGEPSALTAYGALSYQWNTGSSAQSITVSPTSTSSYTVIGTNALGCTGSYVKTIQVKPLPQISVISSQPDVACRHDQLTLAASGGVSYIWLSSAHPGVMVGNPLVIQANASSVYTVTGTGTNGCSARAVLSQNVAECTGISENSRETTLSLWPNPATTGINLHNSGNATRAAIYDNTGRAVRQLQLSAGSNAIQVEDLAPGLYFVVPATGSQGKLRFVKE